MRFTKRALEINPNFGGALNTLAYDLAYLHQYDDAISDLKRYAEMEPNDPNPRDSLGEILQQAGRLEDSMAEYREALKLDHKFYRSRRKAPAFRHGDISRRFCLRSIALCCIVAQHRLVWR